MMKTVKQIALSTALVATASSAFAFDLPQLEQVVGGSVVVAGAASTVAGADALFFSGAIGRTVGNKLGATVESAIQTSLSQSKTVQWVKLLGGVVAMLAGKSIYTNKKYVAPYTATTSAMGTAWGYVPSWKSSNAPQSAPQPNPQPAPTGV